MRPLLHRIYRISSRMFSGDDLGQDLLEYALLVALIAIVAISAVSSVGAVIRDVFWSAIAAAAATA